MPGCRPAACNKKTAAAEQAPAKTAAVTGTNARPVNLDALAQSLAKTAAATPAPPSGARAGPTQAEKDAAQRQAEGAARAATANALQAIGAKIADHWNLNCASDRNITVTLRLDLNRDGSLVPLSDDAYKAILTLPDARISAATLNAYSAAQAASPFTGLPEQTYSDWRSKSYVFKASDVCADRLRKR